MDILYRLGWVGLTNVVFTAIVIFLVRAAFVLRKKRFVPHVWGIVFLSAVCPVEMPVFTNSRYILETILGSSFKFYFFLVWELTAVFLLVRSLLKCRKRKWKSLECERIEDNVFLLKGICKAEVCGFLHPVIYLPEGLEPEVQKAVLERKKKLIASGGQKLVVFASIVTYLNWFNPVLWLSIYYMKADMRRL